jgi:hypothetical protein
MGMMLIRPILGCDSKIEANGPAPDGSAGCNMACTGNAGEICGGANRIDVYHYA